MRLHFVPVSRVLTLGVAIAAGLVGWSAARGSLVDGLVAGYTFDQTSGDFADASGNGNDLFAAGNPYGSGANGIVGGALDLNGSTDYATSGTINNDFANFGANHAFSISFWMNLRNVDSFKNIIGQLNSTDSTGWALRDAGPGHRARIRFNLTGSSGSMVADTAGDVMVANAWQHIVLTYDGSNNATGVSIYVDGVEQSLAFGVISASGDTTADSSPFAVGARVDTLAGQINGQIDEVGVWDRVLTVEEVDALYNKGDGVSMENLPVPEPGSLALLGIVGLWRVVRRGRRTVA